MHTQIKLKDIELPGEITEWRHVKGQQLQLKGKIVTAAQLASLYSIELGTRTEALLDLRSGNSAQDIELGAGVIDDIEAFKEADAERYVYLIAMRLDAKSHNEKTLEITPELVKKFKEKHGS